MSAGLGGNGGIDSHQTVLTARVSAFQMTHQCNFTLSAAIKQSPTGQQKYQMEHSNKMCDKESIKLLCEMFCFSPCVGLTLIGMPCSKGQFFFHPQTKLAFFSFL